MKIQILAAVGLTFIWATSAGAQSQSEMKRVMCEAHPTDAGCPGYVARAPDNIDAVMSVQVGYDTTGKFVNMNYQSAGFFTVEQCISYTRQEIWKEDARAAQNQSAKPEHYGESVLNYPNGTVWYGCVLRSNLKSAALHRYVEIDMDLKAAQSMKMVPFPAIPAPVPPDKRGLPYHGDQVNR